MVESIYNIWSEGKAVGGDDIAELLLVVGKECWSDAAGNAVIAVIDMAMGTHWMICMYVCIHACMHVYFFYYYK